MSFSPEYILLIGSIILYVSIVVGKTGYKFGVPALLLFLIVGMVFGTDGLGLVEFNNPRYAQFIGVIALSIILFSGGMDTKFSDIKPVIREGIVLATGGVFITALATGAFVYLISNQTNLYTSLTFVECLLLASVMASTDSASVFSILRSKRLHLKYNLCPMLELESGSNDPMAYMLTILFIQMILTPSGMSFGEVAFQLFIQLSVGAICGYLLGRLTVIILNKINIQYESLYPILLLALVFFIFSFTDLVYGNGYLAVYIAGVIVGNKRFVHKRSVTSFFDGFAWLCQIIMFITLGLLVNPSELWPVAGLGLLVGIFLILIARPLSVFLCLLPFKLPFKGRLFVSWVGLRGAVPIIFATYPQIAGVPHANLIFNVVFFITLLSLIVQGMSISAVAKWLGLALPEPKSGNTFGMELPEEIKSSMSEIVITDEILKNGNLMMNLSLPDNTLVVMLKRGNQFIVPTGKTQLIPEDKLLVITDNDEGLRRTYESLGISDYVMEKN
ncbi:MAG: potassium/proton antiporter [Odoribacter sp.]|nr:potassium/proton antiporter [Odoribacter sp.]